MSNNFGKDINIAFEQMLEGFNDALLYSKAITVKRPDATEMQRSGNTISYPMPYIMTSVDGIDVSGSFNNVAQMFVPVSLNEEKSVPWKLTSYELRDQLNEGRLGAAAKDRLASDINVAILNSVVNTGSQVVKRTTAATGYDDIALAAASLDEAGVSAGDRSIAVASRDYMAMAGNLGSRQTVAGAVETAYSKAKVNNVAGFDVMQVPYTSYLSAAAGSGITISTLPSAGNYYVPSANNIESSGAMSVVDSRRQVVTVSSTTGVAVGDAFTISGVYSYNIAAKVPNSQLRTFRVLQVLNSTQLVITSPLISGQGGSNPELQYQNCVVTTPASNAAITFLNTQASNPSVFWHKESVLLVNGSLGLPPAQSGATIKTGTTDNGIEMRLETQYDLKTGSILYVARVVFGVENVNPLMNGIVLFNQS